MAVMYLDTLFLLNALVDYLLLLGAARLAGEPLRRRRFGLGAVLGGLYAVGLVLPGGAFLSHPLCRCASAALMMLVAYGGSARLLRQSVLFLALTCAFGGGVVAIGLMGGTGGGLGWPVLDLKTVLLSAAVCYAVLSLFFQRMGRHTAASGELVRLELELAGRRMEVTALTDTGNTLTDPVTGCPVVVAEGERLRPLFPDGARPGMGDLCDPVRALERFGRGEWKSRFRLVPYRAVGVSHGLLLAVRTDRVRVNGEDCGPLLVALSPTPVSDGGGYAALVAALDGERKVKHEMVQNAVAAASGGAAGPFGAGAAGKGDVHRGERHSAGGAEPGGGRRADRPAGEGR